MAHYQPQTGADYCQHGVQEVNSAPVRLGAISKPDRKACEMNCAFRFQNRVSQAVTRVGVQQRVTRVGVQQRLSHRLKYKGKAFTGTIFGRIAQLTYPET